MAIYKEVKEDLGKKIKEATYKSGDRLPAERQLAEAYGVSRMTLRQALAELEQEGYLQREKGRGTFVATPDLYQENLRSFTQTLLARDLKPSSRILEVSRVHHIRHISQMLDIDEGEPYYKIKRLRCGDEVPIALETVYIPVRYARGMDAYELTGSLYKILEEVYEYDITRSACEIEAIVANRYYQDIFEIKRQEALLKVSGITYSQGEHKLFYEESLYRSELYKYHVDILGQR